MNYPLAIERRHVASEDNPLYLQRSPLSPSSPVLSPSGPGEGDRRWDVRVVLAIHGWTNTEESAIGRLLSLARRLHPAGIDLRPVVVQNDLLAFARTIENCRMRGIAYAMIPDPSFAAACATGARIHLQADRDAGLLAAGGGSWLLFTQADVEIGDAAIGEGIGMAMAHQGEERFPPAIGPSGGMLHDWPARGPLVVSEYGRNIGGYRPIPAVAVDWIAGYSVLVRSDAYWRSGGWDAGYGLYFEDIDLSLRLASVGCRSVVVPALSLNHERSVTICRTHGKKARDYMQRRSRERFLSIWERRCREVW
jgi:hypothetical protein